MLAALPIKLAAEIAALQVPDASAIQLNKAGLTIPVAVDLDLMKSIRPIALPAAAIVLILCVYSFLLGNKVFDGKFENEAITWYILAKGIFCSVALVALSRILDGIITRLGG